MRRSTSSIAGWKKALTELEGKAVIDDYRGFKFWLIETTVFRTKHWRIQYPDGRRTGVLKYRSAADIRAEIDRMIEIEKGF